MQDATSSCANAQKGNSEKTKYIAVTAICIALCLGSFFLGTFFGSNPERTVETEMETTGELT